MYLFEYQVNEDDFNAMDVDQDGLVTSEEAFNAIMSLAGGAAGRQNLFSEDGKILLIIFIFPDN